VAWHLSTSAVVFVVSSLLRIFLAQVQRQPQLFAQPAAMHSDAHDSCIAIPPASVLSYLAARTTTTVW